MDVGKQMDLYGSVIPLKACQGPLDSKATESDQNDASAINYLSVT